MYFAIYWETEVICTGFLFPKFSLMKLELIHAAIFSRFPEGYETLLSHMSWGRETKHLLVLACIGFSSEGNQTPIGEDLLKTPIGEDLLKTPVLRLAQLREEGFRYRKFVHRFQGHAGYIIAVDNL